VDANFLTINKINMKKYIFFVIFSMVFSMCTKEPTKSPKNTTSPLPFIELRDYNETADATINIIANDYVFSDVHPASIELSAYFLNNKTLVDLKEFKIGVSEVPKYPEISKYGASYGTFTEIEKQKHTELLPYFGGNIPISANGDFGYTFTSEASLPKSIEIQNSFNEISVGKDFDVKWNVDQTNDTQVGVYIEYQVKRSRELDINLPETPISILKFNKDQSGSVTFTKADLSILPVGGVINIYIGRGRQTLINSQDKEILVNGIAYQTNVEIPIVR
jgi:hypothetical protein